jgi:NhaP-type Na+/H+ or K+/H+ antiporter
VWALEHFRIKLLPESGAFILCGLAVGAVVRLSTNKFDALLSFNPETFFFVFLPPIIFTAAFTLSRRDLWINFGTMVRLPNLFLRVCR